jgi:hypothetical protein
LDHRGGGGDAHHNLFWLVSAECQVQPEVRKWVLEY